MNLKNISDVELANRLTKLVRTERKMTHFILEHIVEFELRMLYAEHGFDSMFAYLTKKLGYGEDSAYRRLKAARILKQVPEVAIKIETGRLNLTQLTEVEKCLKVDKKQGITKSPHQTNQILEKLENCTGNETKKILAVEFNHPLQVHTRISPQKDDSVRLEITLTQEQFKELKTAQSLLSHICYGSDLGEVIATLAQKFNKSKLGKNKTTNIFESATPEKLAENTKIEKKIDPVANDLLEQIVFSTSKPTTQSFLGARQQKRKYISLNAKRSLLKKAAYSCEYRGANGEGCSSQYQLQIDHIKPIASDAHMAKVLWCAH